MMLISGIVLTATAMLLIGCSRSSEEVPPRHERSAASVQANGQPEEQPARSRQSRQAQSGQDDLTEQKVPRERQRPDRSAADEHARAPQRSETAEREQSKQTLQAYTEAQPEQQASNQTEEAEHRGEPGGEPADQQSAVEQKEMGGQVIKSGHRAGLFADRNSVGNPLAPITITVFSDFL